MSNKEVNNKMKVKDLVEELQKFNGESEINVFSSVFPDFDMKVVGMSVELFENKPTILLDIINSEDQ